MSRLSPPSHEARPLSFSYSDDLAWQSASPGSVSPPRSPEPSPRDTSNEVSRLAGNPSTRSSRSGMIPQFAPLEETDNDSTEKSEGKSGSDGALVTVEFKGTRSSTDFSDNSISPTGESPKVAIKPGFRKNWLKLVPHMAAITVTVAVCQLSFRNVYWMDLKPPSQLVALSLTQGGALNALQLAAKLHELLIMASISSIVLHAVQHHLNSTKGLPLVMITNAFELGSAQFLRRGSFWSLLWRVDPVTGKRSPYLSFWLLSIFSTILVTLSGPSAAIAVIPTLGYFDLHQPFNDTILPFYVINRTMPLWPTALSNASLNAINNTCNNPTDLPSVNLCPAGGFRDTYDWAEAVWFGDSDAGSNISFPDTTSTTQRIMTVQSCNSTYSGRASAIGLNSYISSAMTEYWVFVKRNFEGTALKAAQPRLNVNPLTETFAPRIEVVCNSYDNAIYDPKNPTNQTTMMFPTIGGLAPIQVPDQYYKFARRVDAENFTFVELPKTDPLSPSLGAVIVLPLVSLAPNGSRFQSTENIACSIYSQWIPVNVWYEPTVNNVVSFDVAAGLNDSCLSMADDPNSHRQPINTTIDISYANAINELVAFTNGPRPALFAIYQRFISNDSIFIPNGIDFRVPVLGVAKPSSLAWSTVDQTRRQRGKFVATIIAGVVGDGLARVAGDGEVAYSGSAFILPNLSPNGTLITRLTQSTASGGLDRILNNTPSDLKNWLNISPTFQHYGYGYHWSSNRTTQFGISILLIHIIVALIHTVIIISNVTGKYGGLPHTPENIPEMLALAVNSRSSARLRNTCAGIHERKTWVEPLAVRETSLGHLEFIVGRREMRESGLPKVGSEYGALPEVRGEKDG